jgi:hypothetical protein
MLLKLFHEIKREGIFPNSFYKASITLTPRLDNDAMKKENYRPISLMKTDTKFSVKYLQTELNNRIQISRIPGSRWSHSRDTRMV